MADLAAVIEEVARGIEAGRFRSRAEVSQGVVIRILHELGWPVFDVGAVAPELRIGKRTVDYALCHPPDKPAVLVDVRGLGMSTAAHSGDKQLFQYCAQASVPIALLTDGRVWSFFFAAGQGTGDDLLFKQVDLSVGEPSECAVVLDRYLRFGEVETGAFRRSAERDYEAIRSERKAAASYAGVWVNLLKGPDSRLLGLFCEGVERATGIRPGREWAAAFLRNQAGRPEGEASHAPGRPTRGRRRRRVSGDAAPESPRARFWYQFKGRRHSFKNGSDLLVAIFDLLAARDPTFLERYGERHRGQTRRYVASSKDELYDNPEMRQFGKQLAGGWWIDCHCGSPQKEERIRNACRVAGIEFGRDLVVQCQARPRRRRPVAINLTSTVDAPSVPETQGRASRRETGLTRAEEITLKMRGTKNEPQGTS